MTDVEQGGATAFPYIHIAVKPQKGSAVFWYNLNDSGEREFLTRHAGCPVIVGNKWGNYFIISVRTYSKQTIVLVANKWIHEYDQESRRPCTKEYTPDYTAFFNYDILKTVDA